MKRTVGPTILLTILVLGSTAAQAGVGGKCYAGRILCIGNLFEGYLVVEGDAELCFNQDSMDEGKIELTIDYDEPDAFATHSGYSWEQQNFDSFALLELGFERLANGFQTGESVFTFGFDSTMGLFCFFSGEESS